MGSWGRTFCHEERPLSRHFHLLFDSRLSFPIQNRGKRNVPDSKGAVDEVMRLVNGYYEEYPIEK